MKAQISQVGAADILLNLSFVGWWASKAALYKKLNDAFYEGLATSTIIINQGSKYTRTKTGLKTILAFESY